MLAPMNWVLAEDLERMRREDVWRELSRERFLAVHGLDLWSILRRAVSGRLRRPAPQQTAPGAVWSRPTRASIGEGDGRQAA